MVMDPGGGESPRVVCLTARFWCGVSICHFLSFAYTLRVQSHRQRN